MMHLSSCLEILHPKGGHQMEAFYAFVGLAIVIIALVALIVICYVCACRVKLQNGNKKLEVETSENNSKSNNTNE